MFRIMEIIIPTLIALAIAFSIYVILLELRDKRLLNLLMEHERIAIIFLIVAIMVMPFGVSLIFKGRLISNDVMITYIFALFFSISVALALNEAWKLGADLVNLRHRWISRDDVKLVTLDYSWATEIVQLVERGDILRGFDHQDYLEISRLLLISLSGGMVPLAMLVQGYEKLFMSPSCGHDLAKKLFQILNKYQPDEHARYSYRLVEIMDLCGIAANLSSLGADCAEVLLEDLRELGIALVWPDVYLVLKIPVSGAISRWDDLSLEAVYYLKDSTTPDRFLIDLKFSMPPEISLPITLASGNVSRARRALEHDLQAPVRGYF